MAARLRRRVVAVGIVLVALGAAVALVVAGPEPPASPRAEPPPETVPGPGSYANPVVAGTNGHPAVLRAEDGTYYAYVDGFDMGAPFRVMAYASPDLATWSPVGEVLPEPGAWADGSSGRGFTTPSVRHVPAAPAASRYVLYTTAPTTDGGPTCVGVATAPAPEGPFVGAAQPLLCPPGGARSASPVPGSDQVVYRADQPVPGVYAVTLTPDGTAVAPGAEPTLLLAAEGGALRHDALERPAVARDPATDQVVLFVRTGVDSDGVGWSPCRSSGPDLVTCAGRRQLGSWMGPTDDVGRVGGVQVFADGDGALWVAYDGQPAEACGWGVCQGTPSLRIDRLCFAHGVPRTDGPTVGARPLERAADCSVDVPGAELAVAAVADEEVVDQPPEVSFRAGGSAVPLGGRLLWLFGDTFVDPATAGPDGYCRGRGGSRSNSAGYGLPHPFAVGRGYASPLAADGVEGRCVDEFVPLTPDEERFNRTQEDVGLRVALWTRGGIPLADGSALVAFVATVQDRDADADGPDPGCGFCRRDRGLGLVRVRPGDDQADRASTAVSCAPTCLFGPEDGDWSGWPFLADGYVHLYAYTPTGDAVRLGRAPLADVEDRSAWTFRTAAGTWSPDLADAAAVPGLVANPPGVAYNAHLDRFVALVPTSDDVVAVQTAPEPWGPWGVPTPIYDRSGVECPGIEAEDAIPTPWIDDAGGRVMRFTFGRPGADFGRDPACPGQTRLVTVTLATGRSGGE